MIEKQKIYDFVFWTSMSVVAVWIVLKAVGVINTPIIVQLIPYAGGIFAFGAFFQLIKEVKNQVKEIKDDLGEVKKSQQSMLIDTSQIKIRLVHVEKDTEKIWSRLNTTEN